MSTQTFTDQMGYEVQLAHPPRRIVSLVPSLTELLADLGLSEQVVGLTHFCVFPESLYKNRERIGGTKKARVAQIQALEPDLVIANKEENEKDQVEAIKAFCPVWVSQVYDVPSALAMIRQLSEVTGVPEAGHDLINRVHKGIGQLPSIPPMRALYMIWRKPYMAAGGDTFIHEMMKQISLTNILADRDRYPQLSSREISELAPDLVLLSTEPYPFKERHVEELQQHLPHARFRLVDGSMFSWYGSRMEKAIHYLSTLARDLQQAAPVNSAD